MLRKFICDFENLPDTFELAIYDLLAANQSLINLAVPIQDRVHRLVTCDTDESEKGVEGSDSVLRHGQNHG